MRLAQLYEALDGEGRQALARGAGISPEYLWQLATRWKGKKPSLDLLAKLAAADPRLSVPEMVAEFTGPPAEAARSSA